ncbi:MAG: Oxygen-independent coproporphyrinogen-III oxidase 1 [Spirochaetes bacterium ADurb.BinA120]|nr:MAG: Oxygen-independent coproporphyrinogen-III oxidase 1 [Spirochaetes bacterium ADurb.BinA120]HOD40211.1 radical SAM family heme chaperone HemW [Candidatus Wallbacteria bacterium]HPG56441.1 radical SAM family heme chaperone HemW [Candidatus Wallbacteria bacterium]
MHLYIHIPFCLKKCSYCDFASYGIDYFNGVPPLSDYFEALRMEIDLRTASFEAKPAAETIYFGGGTPGVGGIENIVKTLDLLKDKFITDESCEITVETNPRIFDAAGYGKLREAGFNRISIGMQSGDDKVLALLGRVHDASEALRALALAREAGFKNISADFMTAIPYKKGENYQKSDFAAIGELQLDHVSIYQFSVCENTPVHSMVKSGELIELSDEEAAEEYLSVCSQLLKAGFIHYEVSNFARNRNFISRHNRSYWRKEDYMGFGAGAVSTLGAIRQQNSGGVFEYIGGVGTQNYYLLETLSGPDLLLETIMLALRTDEGLRKNAITPEIFDKIHGDPKIISLAENGLLILKKENIALTDAGFLVMNKIALIVEEIAVLK